MAIDIKNWSQRPATDQLLGRLEQWFEGERGARLLASQQPLIDSVLSQCFGYHLLQLSVDPRLELYRECRVQRKYRCHPYAAGVNALSQFEQLPFATESLDTVVLHHAHEFVQDPHQLLREVQRVLVPRGHLIILGFNPWSPMGVYTRFARLLPDSMWHNHQISCHRLKEWLSLLGFEIQTSQYGYQHSAKLPQVDRSPFRAIVNACPFGSFYIISTIKQVAGMTPLKPNWINPNTSFAGFAPVKRETAAVIPTAPLKKEDVA